VLQTVVQRPSISIIMGTCQVISCIYNCLGSISIGQLELVLQRVLLKLAEGTAAAHTAHMAALHCASHPLQARA
jgi:hypothetical protein